jgi:hypothetical protein
MSWNLEYVYGEKGSYKALCTENHKDIADVSLLSDDFIQKLIDEHNNELSKEYEKGIRVGIEISKELKGGKK